MHDTVKEHFAGSVSCLVAMGENNNLIKLSEGVKGLFGSQCEGTVWGRELEAVVTVRPPPGSTEQ